MRLLRFALAALAALLSTSALRAQTADQARLMFSVGIGQTSGGGTLWSVGKQPFIIDPVTTDTLALERRFRRSLDVVLSGTYFPGDHFGFNVEAQLLGLATEDDCRTVTQTTFATSSLCRGISRSERSGSSVALSGGVVYRLASHQPLHPYARVNGGVLITQQSFTKVSAPVRNDPTDNPAELTLYDDPSPSSLQPYLSFGGGVVAVIGRGYQFRFELRDNWVRSQRVDGPTDRQGLTPSTSTVGKHLLTATIGFDIVLERKRGRRY